MGDRAWIYALSERKRGVELLFLPAYSGHEQNPVEKVWWRLKGRLAANRLHRDLDTLDTAVHEFFAGLPSQAVLASAS